MISDSDLLVRATLYLYTTSHIWTPFYTLNNSSKNEPILIIIGAQNPE